MSLEPSVLLEDVPCPMGCPPKDNLVLIGQDRIHNLPGMFQVVRCSECGLMRTNPRPTQETINFYYPEEYGPYLSSRVVEDAPKKISWFRRAGGLCYKLPFKFNTDILPTMSKGRLLEVGCASGSFLHKMAGEGWDAEGVEFSCSAAERARNLGYRVYSGTLENAPKPLRLYDLLVAWMVLEHLHDPVGGLKKLHEWANPGAWLVLSVPNAASLDFRIFMKRWYSLHLPNHLYHFTPLTLTKLLNGSGWTVEKIFHQRILSDLIASTGYALQDIGVTRCGKKLTNLPGQAGRWPYILYPMAWLLSFIGQTGRMTVWAKRQP